MDTIEWKYLGVTRPACNGRRVHIIEAMVGDQGWHEAISEIVWDHPDSLQRAFRKLYEDACMLMGFGGDHVLH